MIHRYVDKEILERMRDGTSEFRRRICEAMPEYFGFYYFPEYYSYEIADFQWDFFEDFGKLMSGYVDEVAWIAFRESAKTTIAKILVCHAICHQLKRYINWDSYDIDNAEAALFDIATWLQTNKRLKADYGNLYRKKKKKGETSEGEPERKRLASFVTVNKVKVEAFSTGTSTRGRIYGKTRPDFFILDDIETINTYESFAIIKKIKDHVDEMRSGLGVTGSVLVLGNYLTEEGVISYLEELIKDVPGKIYRKVALVEEGVPTWPGKYFLTTTETLAYNMDRPKDEWKVSIERKRESLGDKVYQREMMNNPGASGDYYFDRNIIRSLIAKCKAAEYEPISEKGGFKLYMNYVSTHRYAIGADTAEGIGADHNASVLIDFSTKPMRQIGSYKNNQEGPNIFGSTLKKQGDQFGGCFLIPELNNTGYGTIATLIAEKYYNMYIREVKNKTTDKLQKEFGFKTNEGNKSEIFDNFRSAVQDGLLEIMDIELLKEMYHYTKAHLRLRSKEELTKHFDKLVAAVLAWEARDLTTHSQDEKKKLYTAPKPRE